MTYEKELLDLAIISSLELPNIGRKKVNNILSNIQKENESNNSQKTLLPNIIDTNIMSIFKNILHDQYKISEVDWLISKSKAQKIIEQSLLHNINIINFFDRDYPSRLRTIPDPPVLLYYKGDINSLSEKVIIAVVGTRNPTDCGITIAEKTGGILANSHIPVISGLAEGCDASAQHGCVNHNGQTIAVMAHGLDHIYPKQNEKLAQKIIEKKGCLLSEYPIGKKSTRFSFIDRDRLQSGLSDAVIVVETDVKGGTMHTVGYCIKQNKILGCISYPPDHYHFSQRNGNKLLISEKNAYPINSNCFDRDSQEDCKNSIQAFIKTIR